MIKHKFVLELLKNDLKFRYNLIYIYGPSPKLLDQVDLPADCCIGSLWLSSNKPKGTSAILAQPNDISCIRYKTIYTSKPTFLMGKQINEELLLSTRCNILIRPIKLPNPVKVYTNRISTTFV